MSQYYKDFIKPRDINHNPGSFGFYTKHYALLPLVGLVAASIAAVTFFSIHQLSNSDIRTKKKQENQEIFSNRDLLRNLTIERIEKTFATNSDLKSVYLQMEKAQYFAHNARKNRNI